MARILLVGESWFSYAIEVKGFDSYTHGSYHVGIEWLEKELEAGGHEFVHLPSHLVATDWPALDGFDVVLLSDVGANTLLLRPETFVSGQPAPNLLAALADHVVDGGRALGMIGGYLSFGGFEGKAQYAGTPVADVLPVTISSCDDRLEVPEGVQPEVVIADHPALGGAKSMGPLLGYNRISARPDAQVVAKCGDDPLLVVWRVGNGRSFAYASDCGPHWASVPYLSSGDYGMFWRGVIGWAAGA